MKRAVKSAAPSMDVDKPISYGGHRFPPEVISYAVWLYFRFPLSLRMVEEMLAARGIEVTYETVRRWSVKFGLVIARRIRSSALARGDKWQRWRRKSEHCDKWNTLRNQPRVESPRKQDGP